MYKARTCTGCEHVGRQHVPGTNMSGANLIPFFSKNTPKLPFLTEEAQMNFFGIAPFRTVDPSDDNQSSYLNRRYQFRPRFIPWLPLE
jgi:hypothetical protein